MEFQKNFIRRYLIYNLSVSNDISGDARKDLGFTIYISRNFLPTLEYKLRRYNLDWEQEDFSIRKCNFRSCGFLL